MHKLYTAILLLFTLQSFIIGKGDKFSSGYISLHAGNYKILSDKFDKLYDSPNGLIIKTSFGLPLYSNFSFAGSISYYQVKGNYSSKIFVGKSENALLKQALFEVGFEYSLIPGSIINFYLLSGFHFSMIDEERKNHLNKFTYETEGTGNFGYYIGVNGEINLGEGPISIFVEYKYYYVPNPIYVFDDTLEAQNITLGGKIFFSNRWLD